MDAWNLRLSVPEGATRPTVFLFDSDANAACFCRADPVGVAGRVSQYLIGAAVSHLCPISEAMLTCRHRRYRGAGLSANMLTGI